MAVILCKCCSLGRIDEILARRQGAIRFNRTRSPLSIPERSHLPGYNSFGGL
jgi:hypothetical protein